MPPKGWRKKAWVPVPCPNCDHPPVEHRQGACMRCACSSWVVLPPGNDWGLPPGWYEWPPRR